MHNVAAACERFCAGLDGVLATAIVDLLAGVVLGGPGEGTWSDEVRELVDATCLDLVVGRKTARPPEPGRSACNETSDPEVGGLLETVVTRLPMPHMLLVVVVDRASRTLAEPPLHIPLPPLAASPG